MELLTGEQMRWIDRKAIDELGLPGLLLMESAGLGVAEALLADYPHAASCGILILCGKGNNGGDGLVAARHLARMGVTPRVLLLAAADDLDGDAAQNLRAARGSGLRIEEVTDSNAWARCRPMLDRPIIVLDAMLGTGISGGARGLVAEVIDDLNRSAVDVVAIDLPSGLDANTHRVAGPAVGADRTYTLCRPKLPLAIEPGALHAGAWRVIPIGIPDAVIEAVQPAMEWLDAESVAGLLSLRAPSDHKGRFGHLLIVAGSRGKSGAAVLAARAALRSGAGRVTVAAPASVQPVIAAACAESMTEPLPETAAGCLDASAEQRVHELLESRTALAIGPGLGTEPSTVELVRALLAARRVPAVADADALNALPRGDQLSRDLLHAGSWPLVLTPHPGEAARLCGTSVGELQGDRLHYATELAQRTGGVVALKGHRTVVASPEGRLAVNASGNPGMATAGTGDLLTGITGALLARGLDAESAARLAVFVHGDSGDRCASALGHEGMIAGDLVERLPECWRSLIGGGEPAAW